MRRLLIGAVVPVTVAISWEAGSRAGTLSEDGFSSPSAVAAAFVRILTDGLLLRQTGETLGAALLGLLIATVLGVFLGALIGLYEPLRRASDLTIEVLRPIPSVALIPVMLLLFGFGLGMGTAVVAFAALWPVLILTASAVRGVDPRLLEVGRALQFSLAARLWKLVLPAALPGVAVALRTAFGIALVVAVTVEIAANPRGLGFGMISAQQSLQTDVMYATLIWLGFLGWSLNALIVAAERRWLSWFWAARGQT